MALIVEILNNRGSVISHQRCSAAEITIGRSYANDIVLHDKHADAFHLTVKVLEAGGFQVVDRGSMNGTYLEHSKTPIADKHDAESGSEFIVGQTHIRLIDSRAEVADAVELRPQSKIVKSLSHPFSLVVIYCLASISALFEVFQTATSETKFSDYLVTFFEGTAIVLLVLFIVGLISKAARHKWNVAANLLYICGLSILADLVYLVLGIIQFNFGYFPMQWLFDSVGYFCIAFAIGWIVTFNFGIERRAIQVISVTVFAGLVLVYTITQSIASESGYEKMRPPITDRFSSVVLPGVPVVSDAVFVERTENVFDRIVMDDD